MGVTRLYFARLSNQAVIFVYVCDVQSLKGLFQPKAITAAIIKMTTNTRRMIFETRRTYQSRSILILVITCAQSDNTNLW